MAFGKKTQKGQDLVEKHQSTYEKWWIGLNVDTKMIVNGIPCKGIIEKVDYIGNSFSGVVKATLSNGCELYIVSQSYRPKKSDIENYL